MTDDPSDDRREESPGGNDRDDRPRDWMSALVSALEALQSNRSANRRDRTDRTSVEYDVSIGTGLQPPGRGVSSDGRPDDRARPRRRRRSTNGNRLATRRYEDELQVTADVGSATPTDVTVGFDDDRTLVVAVPDRELGRVEVPWRDPESEATINNGVLTVRIRPSRDDESGVER